MKHSMNHPHHEIDAMNHPHHEIDAILDAWTQEVIPAPPSHDASQRAFHADACMAMRRLIELVASGGWAPDAFAPVPAPAPRVPPQQPDRRDRRDLKLVRDDDEIQTLDDDVQRTTHGWRRVLVPQLAPNLTERAFLADLVCGLHRLLEIVVPVGATLDEDGHLVLPSHLGPTGTDG